MCVHLKNPVPYPVTYIFVPQQMDNFNLLCHFFLKHDKIKDFKCAGSNNNFQTEQRKGNLEKICKLLKI